ncbi:SWIM zinc finger family protein [Micromonospora carbonacea]|uniref:SWIM zinc finger family protein n=1 Tax=Micromonospora carbonacea TaxID=47853 RepID=UPI001822E4C8|nr:SWIM zinc finger family protein [Micromonospora carbonacea]MBB5827744.1 putative Zn finger protein [Micromonospora carbonacea]
MDFDLDFDAADDERDPDDDTELSADERRARSFPRFGPGRRIGRKFADTWWGNAWIESMERTALDQEQLRKGRRYAFAGQVGSITVSPGRISAAVHDGDQYTPHDTIVRVGTLAAAEWDRLLDRVAAKAGHIAALLDRDMPHDLAQTADDAGVRLLPGYGDLEPECDCPSWDHPCRHAAALAYQAAWLLDRDPFVLLLMRGRGEAELTEDLRRRNARRSVAAVAAADQAGTPAEEAYAAPPVALPAPPGPVTGEPLALAPLLAGHEAAGIDAEALGALAADAAHRARDLLAGVAPTGASMPGATGEVPLAPEADAWCDAVRLAARLPRSPAVKRLGEASGRAAELPRAVRAWEYAGAAGVDVVDAVFSPPRELVARATEALREAGGVDGAAPEVRNWRNRWTVGRDAQVRYGRDGRWYPFRRRSGQWWPAGPPGPDPADALLDLPQG